MPRHATKTSFKPGAQHPNWRGGIEKLGALKQRTVEDYCRAQARRIIGAPKGMVVHHKDGDVKNNDISNLLLITQSNHVAIHNKERRGKKKLTSLRHRIKDVVLSFGNMNSRKVSKILGIGKTTVLRIRKEYGYVTS